jgi:hypothetical protein
MLITGSVYCPVIKVDWLTDGALLRELAHRLQLLPANEKLGLEADEISQKPADQKDAKKTTGPLNNGGALEIICQDSLAGC